MDAPIPPGSAARLLSAGAHAARNHVATLRSVVLLLDDVEIAAELASATSELQLLLERSITASRVELGERPRRVRLGISELVAFAEHRARREGRPVEHPHELGAPHDRVIDVPGSWTERLLADLLHASPRSATSFDVTVLPESIEVRCAVDEPQWSRLGEYLMMVASACGGSLERVGELAVLRLPAAQSVS